MRSPGGAKKPRVSQTGQEGAVRPPRLGLKRAEFHAKDQDRPKIGLAMGGGGARGIAHIGVLKVLEQAGVPIDFLAGTSMGGIVATPFAYGFSARQIAQEAAELGTVSSLLKLVDWLPTTKGLLQGNAIYDYLDEQLGEDLSFADLCIPLALTAVDLMSGSQVIMRTGRVNTAVRATMAIPGVISPVEVDGAKLVDGGILNNVPADVVREMGADIVIAVDVAAGRLITDPRSGFNSDQVIRSALLPNFALDMWRAQAIMMQEIVRHRLALSPPEVLIMPPVPPDVTTFSFNRVAEMIEIGEAAAREALPEIELAQEQAQKAGQRPADEADE
jgi:NTE family protein